MRIACVFLSTLTWYDQFWDLWFWKKRGTNDDAERPEEETESTQNEKGGKMGDKRRVSRSFGMKYLFFSVGMRWAVTLFETWMHGVCGAILLGSYSKRIRLKVCSGEIEKRSHFLGVGCERKNKNGWDGLPQEWMTCGQEIQVYRNKDFWYCPAWWRILLNACTAENPQDSGNSSYLGFTRVKNRRPWFFSWNDISRKELQTTQVYFYCSTKTVTEWASVRDLSSRYTYSILRV